MPHRHWELAGSLKILLLVRSASIPIFDRDAIRKLISIYLQSEFYLIDLVKYDGRLKSAISCSYLEYYRRPDDIPV